MGYVYYSGCWAAKESHDAPTMVSELDKVGDGGVVSPALEWWKPAVEEAVLKCEDVLDEVVVRPGIVFGAGDGLLKEILWPLVQGKREAHGSVQVLARENMEYAMVHREDLADFVVKLVEKVPHAPFSKLLGEKRSRMQRGYRIRFSTSFRTRSRQYG